MKKCIKCFPRVTTVSIPLHQSVKEAYYNTQDLQGGGSLLKLLPLLQRAQTKTYFLNNIIIILNFERDIICPIKTELGMILVALDAFLDR